MSFWSFIRRWIIIDCFFGGHGNRSQCSSNNDDCPHDDNYLNNDYHYGGYDSCHYDDYARLNNDYDSGVFDDGLGPSAFDDDFDADSGMFDNDF